LRLVGGWLPRLLGGRTPWLSLGSNPSAPLRGPDWVRLRPVLSGICGSDFAVLDGSVSAILSPFSSFPAVLGHEVLARVTEVGESVRGLQVGDRVVLDPAIGCVPRQLEPCAACAAGLPSLCLRAAEGSLAPGMLVGFCRDLPGGWSDELQAHQDRLFKLPDELSDEVGVLIEPFSVALHAVLAAPPRAGDRVVVLGGGTLGQCTVAALGMAAPQADVTLVARHPMQLALGQRLGATRVVRGSAGNAAPQAAVQHAGARGYHPISGPPVLAGGFGQVYDCIGSGESLDAALRVAAPRGRVILVGTLAEVDHLDLTLAWARELDVHGTYVYGRETGLEGEPHTFEAAFKLLAQHPALPLAELVTHRFPLEDWPAALHAAIDRRRSGALKVVFAGHT